MLFWYQRNYPFWMCSFKIFNQAVCLQVLECLWSAFIEKDQSLFGQAEFSSWQCTFPHSTFSKVIFVKTNTSVVGSTVFIWFGPAWCLCSKDKNPWKSFILYHLKTVRGMWWKKWKVFWKIISIHVSGHGRDSGIHVYSQKASSLKVTILTED